MKVAVCDDAEWELTDYGIQIPLKRDRSRAVIDRLREEPTLQSHEASWCVRLTPLAITREDLLQVHAERFVEELLSDYPDPAVWKAYELLDEHGAFKRYDPDQAKYPLSDLVRKSLTATGVTAAATAFALSHGTTYLLCGGCGMHHAMKYGGRGFCLVHDILIAVRKLQAEGRLGRVWIIDVDAHKGDGTAAITRDDPTIQTLSIHMAKGWPLDGPRYDCYGNPYPWLLPSTVDIGVPPDYQHLYLPLLRQGLNQLEEEARHQRPDLAIVVNGSDPYEHDELPSADGLQLSQETLLKRDRLIYDWLQARQVPQLYLMAGGYGDRAHEIYSQFLHWALGREPVTSR